MLLVEPVLREAVDHAAALDRDHELRVRAHELDLLLLDVERQRVAPVADVVAAVDLLHEPLAVPLLDREVAQDGSPVLLGMEAKVLPKALAHHLEVLDEQVRLVLAVELGVLPSLADVVELPERGRLLVPGHFVDEIDHEERS